MTTPFEKAVEYAKKAADYDLNGKNQEAMNSYALAAEHFIHTLKYESLPDATRKKVFDKVQEYTKRAEVIQSQLNNPKKEPVVTTTSEIDDDYAKVKESIKRSILQDKLDIRWEDIAGLETAKQSLQEAAILPTKFPQLFTGTRKPWRGILLFGPPGTGKTQLAKAVATEANGASFLSVTSSDLISKWLGESEKHIKALFDVARENSPSVIFIDEIDSICSSRSENENESTRRVKTEILNQMQGVKNDNNNVLVLGATNNPWILDSAVRRRFEKRIYIPLPDTAGRHELFKIQLEKMLDDVPASAITVFSSMTDGFSGHDIVSAINEANMEPVRKVQHATHFKYVSGPSPTNPNVCCSNLYTPCSPGDAGAMELTYRDIDSSKLVAPVVTLKDIKNAIQRTKPSVSKDDLVNHEKFMEEFGMGG